MEILDKDGLTEAEYLKVQRSKNYPKPSLTADVVIFAKNKEGKYEVLLIKRGGHPFIGSWAFPGGFAEEGEYIEDTAARELQEETGISDIEIIPVGLFSKPGRDPRGWTVSQVYMALVNKDELKPKAADDAADTDWMEISVDGNRISLMGKEAISFSYEEHDGKVSVYDKSSACLAFDHDEILIKCINKLFS